MGLTKPCGFEKNSNPTEPSSVGRLIVSTVKAGLCARKSQKSWALAHSPTETIKSIRTRKRLYRYASNDTFPVVLQSALTLVNEMIFSGANDFYHVDRSTLRKSIKNGQSVTVENKIVIKNNPPPICAQKSPVGCT